MASILLLVLLVALPIQQAQAADKWWDTNGSTAGSGNAGGTWSTGAANWSTSSAGDVATVVWTAGDAAFFSAGTDGTGEWTVNCPSAISAGSVTVEEGTVNLTGSGVTTQTIVIGSGTTLSYVSSGAIVASAGATMTINGGTFRDTNQGANGTFLNTNMGIVLGTGGGTLSYTGSASTLTLSSNLISGTGPLTKAGTGILRISGACSYSGSTIINEGTLQCNGANRLPTGTAVTINSPGIFSPAATSASSTQVATVNGNGAVTFSASGTLIIAGSGNSTIPGVIGDGLPAANVYGKVVKSGAGTLTLQGVNTYDGSFTLSAGTTTVDPGATLGDATLDVYVNGGTLNLNNAAQTIENLNGSGGTINLALGHTLTSDPAGNAVYAGSIAGQGALKLVYPYILALNGTNTYTGGTTVTAGTIEVGGSIKGNVTLGATTAFLKLNNATALDSGATLNLDASPVAGTVNLNFAGTQTISALYFGAQQKAAGTWGSPSSAAAHKNAAFTGSGLLLVTTGDAVAPTIVMSPPSVTSTSTGPVTYEITYSGADAVTLANGDITLNKTGTADAGSVVVSGSGLTTRTVTISGITGGGTLGISIAAGTASDIPGNTAPAAGPSTTFDVVNHVASYGLNNRAVADAIMNTASGNFKFTVWGKVTKIDNDNFTVEDGSSMPVKVVYTGHGLSDGDYASATGTLNVGVAPPVLTALSVKKQN